MPTPLTRFAKMTELLPSRYAPGHELDAYPYDPDPAPHVWYPVIYYPTDEAPALGGPLWLVEPYPAARADGTDGLTPISEDGGAGVAVLRADAAPRPRGAHLDGDWIIARTALAEQCAYDVAVATDEQLMAAWCEAYAIAAALNDGTVAQHGLAPLDLEVLLAAERGALHGDSRLAGRAGELRWTNPPLDDDRCSQEWLPAAHGQRLRGQARMFPAMIEPAVASAETEDGGEAWTRTAYTLTRRARKALAAVRARYDGARRCRLCGCTERQPCPAGCGWAGPDVCTAPHQVSEMPDGHVDMFVGVLTDVVSRRTRQGRDWATATLTSLGEQAELLVYANEYLTLKEQLVDGAPIRVRCRVDRRDGACLIVCPGNAGAASDGDTVQAELAGK